MVKALGEHPERRSELGLNSSGVPVFAQRRGQRQGIPTVVVNCFKGCTDPLERIAQSLIGTLAMTLEKVRAGRQMSAVLDQAAGRASWPSRPKMRR